jgi:hypothetical protein
MDSLDPFTPKVGDVYVDGQHVGTIHKMTPSPLGWLLIIAVGISLICGVTIAFFRSFVNLVEHGQFVSDSLTAEMLENRDNPNYFTEYAARAHISVGQVDAGFGRSDVPSDPRVWLSVTINNGSADQHRVELAPMQMRVRYHRSDGSQQDVVIGMDCRPYQDEPSVPANSSATLVLLACDSPPTDATAEVLAKPKEVRVLTIDGRPLTGGPPNTPCDVGGCPGFPNITASSPVPIPPADASSSRGSGATTPPPTHHSLDLSFEAESQDNTYNGGTGTWDCAGCGGGEALQLNDANGSVTFPNINAPADGSYTLTIYYVSAALRSLNVKINDGGLVHVDCPATQSVDAPDALRIPIELRAGRNTITISVGDNSTPAIDRITIK